MTELSKPSRAKALQGWKALPDPGKDALVDVLVRILWDSWPRLSEADRREIHGWVAHAWFQNDPDVQAHKEELRDRGVDVKPPFYLEGKK